MMAFLCLLSRSSLVASGLSLRTFVFAALATAVVVAFGIRHLRRQHATRESAVFAGNQKQPAAGAMDRLETVRPKMLLDSVFLPTETGGVYFRSRGGSFTLNEAGTYELVTELVPRFLGKQTVAKLCDNLAAQRREPARKLITTLLERRIVIDHVEEISDLSQAIRDKFAAQIEFIEHHADRPLARFSQFRHSRILLTGSGIPLRILALSLARNGLEKIILDSRVVEIERDDEFGALRKEFELLGIPLTLERVSVDEVFAANSHSITAICYASDVAALQQMASINRFSCANRVHLLPGFLFGGKAFVGPLVRSDQAGCWMCALLRHSANVSPDLEALLWRHLALDLPWNNDGQPASSPSLRILGNLVGFEIFRFFAGHIPFETDNAVLSIDLETLENGTSHLLPHPNCPHCSKIRPDDDHTFLSEASINSPAENLDLARKLKLTEPLVDPEFGIIRRFDDDELVQLPLFQSAVILSRAPGRNEVSTPGYSIQSNAGARLDALLNAVSSYVTLTPNKGRFWKGTRKEALRAGLNPLPEQGLSNWMGGPALPSDRIVSWMYARFLGIGTIHVVNAGAVYSRSPVNTDGFEEANAGIGIGFTFRQACADAILSLFAHEVLKRVAIGEVNFNELLVDRFPESNVNFQYLRNVFRHMDRSFRILEFSHEGSGRVALAFSPNDVGNPSRIAVGTAGLSQPAAVVALTELLALTIGSPSIRTVEHYLPCSLGYVLDLPESGNRGEDLMGPQDPSHQNMNSILFAFGGAFTDIAVVNLTDEDTRRSNLIAVKALFVRGL